MSVRMLCANTMRLPRQASPATPPQEGNCLSECFMPIRCNHPVRLRRRVQTRCNRPSVSVLAISLPKEGNCLSECFVSIRCNHPVRLRLPPLHRRGIVCPNALCQYDATIPSGFAAAYRRDAIAVVYLY